MLMHIITDFTAKAGAETMLARLLRVSQDSRIIVASLVGVSDHNRKLADNPHVIYAPQNARTALALAPATFRLARLIRAEQPTAILCWMYHAMVVGTVAKSLARTNTPIFWTIRQSLDDPAALSRSSRLALALGRHLSGLPAGIIYNSSRALELHGAYGYRNRNTTVIPNGFDLPETVRLEAKVPRVLGIAGRFHPQKDHATFFHAAALTAQTHPQTRFIAAGLGLSHGNPAVVSLIKAAGLAAERIDLRGEVEDISDFYRDIDALVLSSRTEGFPNVVAEAMSYGKPVITTDVGDAAMVVADTGFVVPPRNAQALADAMRMIFDLTPESYAGYARAARERIKNDFALAAIAEKYRTFLGT